MAQNDQKGAIIMKKIKKLHKAKKKKKCLKGVNIITYSRSIFHYSYSFCIKIRIQWLK